MILAACAAAVAAALAARALVPPTPRLAGRVRPYTVGARGSLGRPADPPSASDATWRRLLGPLLEPVVRRVTARLDPDGEERLERRIQQADLLRDVAPERRAAEFRLREAAGALAGGVVAATLGLVVGTGSATVVGLGLVGAVAGGARPRGRLNAVIEDRRTRMRIELYTVNQLLAMQLRVGGGVAQALRRLVDRGEGALVDELREILLANESGLPLTEALQHAAAASLEPHVARTYRLLAAGAQHGADLGQALLDHSDDVREARREALRRAAVRRRAAMLVPIIAILAPVMLLFIAAPIPSIVFGMS